MTITAKCHNAKKTQSSNTVYSVLKEVAALVRLDALDMHEKDTLFYKSINVE